MCNKPVATWLSVLFLLIECSLAAQSAAQLTAQPPAPALRKLSGDDEKRATELEAQIRTALQ